MRDVLRGWLTSPPLNVVPGTILCLAAAAVLFLSMIVIGAVTNLAEKRALRFLSFRIGRPAAWFIVYKLTFVGTVIHECSHAVMGWLTGAQILEVKCLTLRGQELGFVKFRLRGNRAARALQLGWLSCAPVLSGLILVPVCVWAVLTVDILLVRILAGYLGVSVFIHMSMSKKDILNYCKGFWGVLPVFYFAAVLLRASILR